jgi:hypothetical protein
MWGRGNIRLALSHTCLPMRLQKNDGEQKCLLRVQLLGDLRFRSFEDSNTDIKGATKNSISMIRCFLLLPVHCST